MPLYTFACDPCGIEHPERFYSSPEATETCPKCREPMVRVPQPFYADAWGQPRFVGGLDREFASKSDMRKQMRREGWVEAGDPVKGARNEDHLRLGKGFSYQGQRLHRTAAEGS